MDPYGSERLWYWIGAALLGLGAFGMVLRSRGKSRDTEPAYVFHMFVCFTATIFYVFMALDQMRVEILPEARHIYVARYTDWSITTPLLLLGLCSLALGELRRRSALVVGIVLADIAIMLTGLAAALSHVQDSKVTWYIVSCAFQLAVYALVWGPLRREANSQLSPAVGNAFTRNATFLSVLWVAYPIVWLFAPAGFHLYDAATEALIYMVLDVIAKVFYGFFAISAAESLIPHANSYSPIVEPLGTLGPNTTGGRTSERVQEPREYAGSTRR